MTGGRGGPMYVVRGCLKCVCWEWLKVWEMGDNVLIDVFEVFLF